MTSAATIRRSSRPREEYETGRGGGLGNLRAWGWIIMILIIVIDVVAVYALCVYDSRRNLGTTRPA